MSIVKQTSSGTAPGDERGLRIALVDDHPLMLSGLVHAFERHDGFEVVATGVCAKDAVEIAHTHRPDLMFLDIKMPGDGIEAGRTISSRWPTVRVIMLTAYDGEQLVLRALSCGASGYLLKGVSSVELVGMARAVHRGECYVPAGFAGALLGRRHAQGVPEALGSRFVALTSREQRILQRGAGGAEAEETGAPPAAPFNSV